MYNVDNNAVEAHCYGFIYVLRSIDELSRSKYVTAAIFVRYKLLYLTKTFAVEMSYAGVSYATVTYVFAT